MLLNIVKVTGSSLYPAYQDGDFVIVSRIPILFSSLKAGDVIVFQHPAYGRMIKRVESLEAGGQCLRVVGDHEASVDSRVFGPVALGWVQGRVVGHIHPRR